MSIVINSKHPHENAKRIILLGHGLNNPSHLMDSVGAWFDDSIIITTEFSGHKKNSIILDINHHLNWKSTWVKEMEEAIHFCQKLSQSHKIPLFFCGFSLSCAIWLLALSKMAQNPFKKAIFLAPAITPSPFLKCLHFFHYFSFFQRFNLNIKIASLNSPSKRVHSSLPISMYKCLYEIIEELQKIKLTSIPILMLIDRRDKVVSPKKIAHFITHKNIRGQIIKINCYPEETNKGFHLIFDAKACGEKTWKQLSITSNNFFSSSNHGRIMTVPVAPYEHYFLNEESESYPISIQIILRFKHSIDQNRLKNALLFVLQRHPLLRSLVSGRGIEKRSNLQWLLLNPDINLLQVNNFNHNEIYLQHDIALRMKMLDEKKLKFYFHHAAIDGMGGSLFIQELLLTYAGRQEILSHPYPIAKLASRSLPPRPPQSQKSLLILFFKLLSLIKFISFKPTPIESSSHHDRHDRGPEKTVAKIINETVELSLNLEESQVLLIKTKNKNLKFNSILLAALFNTIFLWNNKNQKQNIRISMPVNHRDQNDRDLSACNKTGISFIDRKISKRLSIKDAVAIEKEMFIIKVFGLSFFFNQIISFMGRFRRGLKLLITDPSKEICATTTCLSNLGILDSSLLHEFKEELSINTVSGFAPIRPGTKATFGVSTLWNCLQFNINYDTKYLTQEDANIMLNIFIQEIKQLLEEK